MKRGINCLDCAKIWKKVSGVKLDSNPLDIALQHSQNEGVKQVAGKLNRHCLCDCCSRKLVIGESVIAVSVYSDSSPYYEWESEFIANG